MLLAIVLLGVFLHSALQAIQETQIGEVKLFNAEQSTTMCYSSGTCDNASLAIDGDWDTYSRTETTTYWWQVSMANTIVHQIVLKAGASYGKEITVSLYNGETLAGRCKSHSGSRGIENLRCDRVKANRVRLAMTNTRRKAHLTVWEIKVTGADTIGYRDQFTTLSGYPASPAIDREPFTARKWDIGSTKDDASTSTWLVTGAYINATECSPAQSELIITKESGLNLTFTVPENSNVVNITGPSGTKLDVTEMSKLSHSFIKLNTISADSGNYTMYINTDGVESSCQAGVYFYSMATPTFKFLKAELEETWIPMAPVSNVKKQYRTYGATSDTVGRAATLSGSTLDNDWLGPTALEVTLTLEKRTVTNRVTAKVSGDCLNRKRCDGVMDCFDGADETNCRRIADSISKLVVDTTSDKLIAPHGDQTLCFYSYSDSFRVYQDDNGVIVIGPGTSEDDKPEGAYCVVFTASNTIYTVKVQNVFTLDELQERERQGTNAPVEWQFKRIRIARVILFNKLLSETEMLNYIKSCSDSSYPPTAATLYDHHLFITLNKMWGSGGVAVGLREALCGTKVNTLNKEYNPLTTYVCNDGDLHINHCSSGQICGDNDDECEYKNSEILALNKSCTTNGKIINAYNNDLGLVAISSANMFTNEKRNRASFDGMLKQGDSFVWWDKQEVPLTYNNFADTPAISSQMYGVLINNGIWEVSVKQTENKLCKNDNVKAIQFATVADVSQLTLAQPTSLAKFSLCFVAEGAGTLLHYIGAASLTNKDLIIHISEKNNKKYLTIYVNGFPEYFDITLADNSDQYICMRWEKATGRIDLAVAGSWLVGDNVYASNRKGSLPRRGSMTVGAGMKLDETAVEGSYVGKLGDLVIWSDFFSPSVLITASKQRCSEGFTKTKSWLSFDTIIAGVQNVDALLDASTKGAFCQSAASKKKRDTSEQLLQVSNSEIIKVDYSKYLADSSEISKWLIGTVAGSTVTGDINDVVVRRAGTEEEFKILPQKKLCINNEGSKGLSSATITFGDSETATFYEINGKVFSESQPTLNDIPGSDPMCIKNVMSASDYAPYSGFIKSIMYTSVEDSTVDAPQCSEDIVTDAEYGTFEWIVTDAEGSLTLLCQYGSAGGTSNPGLATRTCSTAGEWETAVISDCAVRLTIDSSKIDTYFNTTEVTNENTEEYVDNINTIVTQGGEIDDAALDTATTALDKLADTDSNIEINDELMGNVVDIADAINRNTKEETLNKEQAKRQASTKVVKSVSKLAGRVRVVEGKTFSKTTETVSVAAYRPKDNFEIDASTGEKTDKVLNVYASFTSKTGGTDIAVSESDPVDATSATTIRLPVTGSDENVWFTSYNDSKLFNGKKDWNVTGEVIGAGLGEEETRDIFVLMVFELNVTGEHALCQYWDMDLSIPDWSSEGMKFVSKNSTHITCAASHLTNFAILVNPSNTVFTEGETLALQVLTILGLVLSILGLLATVIGLAVFRKIRSAITNKVHIGLSVSLLVSYIVLLVGLDRTEHEGGCYFFAILLHFCFLSAFCWMLCEAANLYLRLVMVFSEYNRLFLKFTLFSVIVPTVVVLITIIVEFGAGKSAYLPTEEASGLTTSCWLAYEARMAAFMFPLLLMLCFNFVVFVLVMKVLFTNKKADKSSFLPRIRSAICVSTLIGLTWIVGILALGEASFAVNVIFTILNSTQGALIFYLYCFAKSDVVSTWKNSFKKSFTSTTTSRVDKSGISSSSMVHPSKTQSTSVAMQSTTLNNGNNHDNVYTNGATVDTDKVEYASAEELKEEEEDEHIYETAEPLPEPGVRLRAATTLERNAVKEDLGEVEVGGNLKGIVKDKVVEFETLARNSTLESNPRVACHVSADPDTCPQSLKQTNSGSKAPFRV